MSDGLRKMMEDERAEGRNEGFLKALYTLVHDGILSIKEAAARANMSEAAFSAGMQKTSL